MKKIWNILKRRIFIIDAIKHEVAQRFHFEDYEQAKGYLRGWQRDMFFSIINEEIKKQLN